MYDRHFKGETTLKFYPSARHTFVDEIRLEQKRRSTPGPGTYKLEHSRVEHRSQQFSAVKQDQLQQISDVAFRSLQTPAPIKYKPEPGWVSTLNTLLS